MELTWKQSVDLSAYHLAWCFAYLPDRVPPSAQQDLERCCHELSHLVANLGVADVAFWDALFTLSPECPSNTQLSERIVRRLVGGANTSSQASELAGQFSNLKAAFGSFRPNAEEELRLRAQPLQQLWQAYGPGLLAQLRNLVAPDIIVSRAEIILVQPAAGGFGHAHLSTNRIHFEAVLTNPNEEIPEVLRLAWLLSQLDLERPVYSELINRHRLGRVAGLALVPAVLEASGNLGISTLSESHLEQAIEAWLSPFKTPKSKAAPAPNLLAPVIMSWWETWRANPSDWRVALTGLDRMLEQLDSV